MMERTDGQRLGELLRDRGVLLAATGRRERMARAALRLLDVLVMRPDGAVTSDDIADDLADAWGDGGKWVGSCVLALAREGLIVEVGCVRSARPSRHRGRVTLWGMGDRDAVDRRRGELRAMLTALDAARNDAGESVAADPPAVDSTADTPKGDRCDGPTN